MINTLHFSICNKQDHTFQKSLIDAIENYTKIHFQTEEHLLEKSNYPELASHRKLHDELAIRREHINKEFIDHDDYVTLLQFLKEWWTNHINKDDMEYVSHVMEYIHN
ncbi:hemerythrin family protein [Chitinivibrio alkaliphilus ACht1]|uniref:Hemerythrin family protein n=1 Tax=Chitinivibrio alkaliphilus ACht1 TaxID=1313304 RepID=U7D724_9BACT|nr:hemerythrin family protein [Chitinivibrio alkaliphilus ACht1]